MSGLAEVPDGWTLSSIEALAEPKGIAYGVLKPGPQVEGGVPMLRVSDVRNGRVDQSQLYGISDELDHEYRRTKLRGGEVLVSIQGSVGRAAVVPPELAGANISRTLAMIRLCEPELAGWVQLALESPQIQHAIRHVIGGTTRDSLNLRDLRRLEIPIAPEPQRSALLSFVERLRSLNGSSAEHLAAAHDSVESFRQVVLAAACSGRLTADWRARSGSEETATAHADLPDAWAHTTLGDLAESFRGGSTQVPVNEPSEYPILRSSSVRPFEVDYDDVRFLSAEQSQRRENFLEVGDLLITRLSGSLEYVGNCALVLSPDACRIQYPDRLFRCRLKDPNEAPYVEVFFAGPAMRRQIEDASRSAAGHQRISIADLKSFTIARPPLDEQREIVRRVDQLLTVADRLERRIDVAAARVDRSSEAVLAKSFRGDLVTTNGVAATGDHALEEIVTA
jgi:type I restriction enzyme S subunit